LEKVSELAYKLKIPPSWHHHLVFNEALLTPYIPPSYPSQSIPRPPPELNTEGIPVYKSGKNNKKLKGWMRKLLLSQMKRLPRIGEHLGTKEESHPSTRSSQGIQEVFRTKTLERG
jgi:hypothetical protein